MQPRPEKHIFLRSEFHRLAAQGAMQRARIYVGLDVPEAARQDFRAHLRCVLEELAPSYYGTVSEEEHVCAIRRLSTELSAAHCGILRDGRFRLGPSQKAVNLFLKYLWCAEWIPTPPHCPFDARIIEMLAVRRIAWTELDDPTDYAALVAAARREAGDRSLAEWELKLWNAT